MSDTHHCHAIDCSTPIPPRLVMCLRHWRLVPSDVQRAIWGAYRKGQERDKRPSQAYLYHQRRAVMHVALQEGRVTLCPMPSPKSVAMPPGSSCELPR